MVIAPVYSSACADTSGASRHRLASAGDCLQGVRPYDVTALAAAALSAPVMNGCCQLGAPQIEEGPPPLAPPSLPSFQTCSLGGFEASVMVVPPTPTTNGSLAGSLCESTGATGAGLSYAHSSDPESPEEF